MCREFLQRCRKSTEVIVVVVVVCFRDWTFIPVPQVSCAHLTFKKELLHNAEVLWKRYRLVRVGHTITQGNLILFNLLKMHSVFSWSHQLSCHLLLCIPTTSATRIHLLLTNIVSHNRSMDSHYFNKVSFCTFHLSVPKIVSNKSEI